MLEVTCMISLPFVGCLLTIHLLITGAHFVYKCIYSYKVRIFEYSAQTAGMQSITSGCELLALSNLISQWLV